MGLFESLSEAVFGDDGADSPADRPRVGDGPIDGETLAAVVPAIASAEVVDRSGGLVTYQGSLAGDAPDEAEVYAPATADEAVTAAFRDRRSAWESATTTPGVVDVLAAGDDPRPWFAVATPGTALPESDVRSVRHGLAVATEIAAAFENVAVGNGRHWDLRPEHVHVIDPGGSIPEFARADVGEYAAVGDWGLRRAMVRATGESPSVSPYDAPEQVAPDRFETPTVMNAFVRQDVDVETAIELDAHHADSKPWIDAHRVGAVAYEVLTGRPPFDPDLDAEALSAAILDGEVTPASEVNGSLPERVDPLLAALLETDPAERPMAGWVTEDFEELFEATGGGE